MNNVARLKGLLIAWFFVNLPSCLIAGEWFNEGKVPLLELEISPEAMTILRAYQWEWGGNDAARTNVAVTVKEGSVVYTNVALHLKGAAGSFRPIDNKPAMTLHFDEWVSGQRFHGLEKIHLNNSVQDQSFSCEVLARELFEAAGVPVTRASHALVELNGRSLGLYVLVEGWNKQFLKRHFSNTRGILYDGGFGQDIDGKLIVSSGSSPQDRSMVKALADAARDSDTTNRLGRLEKVLDMERFLSFAAMEVLVTHVDGYCIGRNNYRLFQDLGQNRMVFLPHGLDQLFGAWRSTPEYLITPNFRSLVSSGVMDTRDGRRRYLERVGTLYTNLFLGDRLITRLDEITHKLCSALNPDPEAKARLIVAAENLKHRVERRIASVGDQLVNPPQPLKFGEDGSVQLKGWTFRPDSSRQSSGTRNRDGGTSQLVIRGPVNKPRTFGSWRTSVLLREGRYEFQGKAKLIPNEEIPGAPPAEAALRISRDRAGYPLTASREWEQLHYSFDLVGTTELELVCELRGVNASACFDLESLRLVEHSNTKPVQ